jgi:DnaJ-domain-containing protein 1
MPTKKRKTDFAPQHDGADALPCHVPGCKEAGEYKAPKSRSSLNEYQWFCLEHIREHNQRWDYFADMERDEIEDFLKDAVIGHRPTWTRESNVSKQYEKLQDALYEFLNMGATRPKESPAPLPAKLRKALALLDMEYPYEVTTLKTQYRTLVKKHHPDVNKGNKKSEELFKQITAAYHTLNEHIKVQS